MKKHLALLATTFILMLLIDGCTNVPLSENSNVSDPAIFGFWQNAKGESYQIVKNDNGTASLVEYKYDSYEKKFVKDKDYGHIYFTDITKKGETFRFISVKDDDVYGTYRFSFNENGSLVLLGLSDSYIKKFNKDEINEAIKFKNADKFRQFVTDKLGNNELFEDAAVSYRKCRSVSDFRKPGL